MIKHITLKDAYLNFWRKSLDFSGRSTRKEYWFPMIINLIILLAMIALGDYLDQLIGMNAHSKLSISNVFDKLFGTIFSIGVLSVTVRRFHDINLTGTFAIVPGVIATAMVILSLVLTQFDINTSLIMNTLLPVIIIICAIIFLITLAKDGTHGKNKYGEDPLNRSTK